MTVTNYELIQEFSSPITAITLANDEKKNGLIANSVIRASLIPDKPRLAFYLFKAHYSYELLKNTQEFVIHMLHNNQFDLIYQLGFKSGRNQNKLAETGYHEGHLGLPVLDQHVAYFECRVCNTMDAGASTFVMGDVLHTGRHPEYGPDDLMTGDYFKENIPSEWADEYLVNRRKVQKWASEHHRVKPDQEWEIN